MSNYQTNKMNNKNTKKYIFAEENIFFTKKNASAALDHSLLHYKTKHKKCNRFLFFP